MGDTSRAILVHTAGNLVHEFCELCLWKKAYDREDKAGLLREPSPARCHPRQVPPMFVKKVLNPRTTIVLAHSELPDISAHGF